LRAWQLIDLRTENPILDNYVISKEGIRGQLQVLVENQIISAQEADRVRNDISANPDQYPGLADDDDVVLSLLFEKGAMTTESIDDFRDEISIKPTHSNMSGF